MKQVELICTAPAPTFAIYNDIPIHLCWPEDGEDGTRPLGEAGERFLSKP